MLSLELLLNYDYYPFKLYLLISICIIILNSLMYRYEPNVSLRNWRSTSHTTGIPACETERMEDDGDDMDFSLAAEEWDMDDNKAVKKEKSGSFAAMGLEQNILNGLNRMGYKLPTPVQRKALPIALAGMDIVCMARTGSGKTCVFLLPLVQKLKMHQMNCGVRAIVLSPTRELAIQTFKFAKDMAKFTDLRIVSIVGGDSIDGQFEALSNKPDVIIATPGRLMHMIREISTFKLKSVKYLVFDEADRLFEMGFAEQLNEIVRECPQDRQTLLFSATMPKMLIQFSRAGLRDPQLIRLDTDTKMSDELRMGFFCVRSNEKVAALLYLVRRIIPADQLSIVFAATRHHSEFLHLMFNKVGVSSTVVYGAMDQDARNANLRAFRNGEVSYLIVTDVAARGIDVPLLNNVINFHFPSSPKLFVHRCGRAARQGRIGFALSLVEPDEMPYVCDVISFLGKEIKNKYEPEVDGGVEVIQADGTLGYNLETMTPNMVHTGLLPQDVIDEENDFLKRCLADDDILLQMWKTSENGMIQYKRTRTEASHGGVKLAKATKKSQTVRDIHPLIIGCDPKKCSKLVAEKAAFVRMLQTFRPAQTVFESGIGTGTSSKAVKGVQKKGGKDSKGVEMMKALRKATASGLERNKDKIKAMATLEFDETKQSNDWEELDVGISDEFVADADDTDGRDDDVEHDSINEEGTNVDNRSPRLSIAERRKLKKKGLSQDEMKGILHKKIEANKYISDATSAGSTGGDYKDKRFYMSYGNENEKERFEEDNLQPQSNLRSHESQSATMLEQAMLDVDPEDAMAMNNKKRMLRWDAKKRKFVKQSLEEMAGSKRGPKRLRTESGVLIKGSSLPQGEMYEKWKKKSKREINNDSTMGGNNDDADDDRPRPNFKVNTNVKDELKSAPEIRKSRKQKDKLKLKNMEKDKRSQVIGKMKQKSSQFSQSMNRTKAGSKKVKAIWRN